MPHGETNDPATRTWSATGPMPAFPSRHTGTLLPNGKVLVVGGHDSIQSATAAELYDPAARTWAVTGLAVGGVVTVRATVELGGDRPSVSISGQRVTRTMRQSCKYLRRF